MVPAMLTTTDDKKKEVEELKAKRNLIFARLQKNPEDTHLALEIKLIDDQIADAVRQMDQSRGTRQEGRTPSFRS
jgi:hypothetical protein